jgi:type II secretory pathway component GspD/PulD (secretin)
LKGIIEKTDQPMETATDQADGQVALPVMRTHPITTADPSTAFDVLQTLLAGTPDARIAVEPKTNAIIAFARPETQEIISQTIAQLEGDGESFKVINLRRLDPSQALLTINKFFGVTEEGGEGPTVDGDPVTGRLWVRGTPVEIELVENLINELEGDDTLGELDGKIRILPYTGRAAEEALQRVETLWPMTNRSNRIRTITPARSDGSSPAGGIPERRVLRDGERQIIETPEDTGRGLPAEARGGGDTSTQLVTFAAAPIANDLDQPAETDDEDEPSAAKPSDIIVQMSPSGIIIASDDAEALDTFEMLMESIAEPTGAASSLPTIFWLKYTKADVAAELISNILGGAEASASSLTDSIMGGIGGGMLGGLMGLAGGGGDDNSSSAKSILTSTGSVSIVADARLNALIVQANAADMQMIEMILEKIDRQESPEDVEVIAKPALIPVIYQDANDVAEVVKSVFAEKINGDEGGRNARGGGGGGNQPSPQDFIAALRGARGGRGGGGSAPTSEPSKITVSVDERSNSLVVIATPQDFEEVRQLVEALDQGGISAEESVAVLELPGKLNPEAMREAIEAVLGTQVQSSGSDSSSSASSASSGRSDSDGAPSPADIQRRIEAFRAMRERLGGGGGPLGGARPGGGRPAGGLFGGRSGGGPFSGGRPGGGASGRGGR